MWWNYQKGGQIQTALTVGSRRWKWKYSVIHLPWWTCELPSWSLRIRLVGVFFPPYFYLLHSDNCGSHQNSLKTVCLINPVFGDSPHPSLGNIPPALPTGAVIHTSLCLEFAALIILLRSIRWLGAVGRLSRDSNRETSGIPRQYSR